MPFMNVADAYSFNKACYKFRLSMDRETNGSWMHDMDLSSMYLHNINQGITPGQLQMIASGRNSGKSYLHDLYKMHIHYLDTKPDGEKMKKQPDIMNIPDGDIPELLNLHNKTMSTISKTIHLWELMMSVYGSHIELDSINSRHFSRNQEYFLVQGKRYSVQYTHSEFKILVQDGDGPWKETNPIIELCNPRSHKVPGMYVLNRWSFHRASTFAGTDIVSYSAGSGKIIPVLDVSDMEAYLFQESLVQSSLNRPVLECLGSSCEQRLPYNFETLDIQLKHLVQSDECDDFSIIIGLIIAQQYARMEEYKSYTSLEHDIRIRSKFGKEFDFE